MNVKPTSPALPLPHSNEATKPSTKSPAKATYRLSIQPPPTIPQKHKDFSSTTNPSYFGISSSQSSPFPSSSNIFKASEESIFIGTPKHKRKTSRRRHGNGLMFIAIIHLLLACGLIDVGIFMSARFAHIALIWPDTYEKLIISKNTWFGNQIITVRKIYSPVTVAIGSMIFFPKLIFLLEVFFAKVKFWRIASVDGSIAVIAIIYAIITGFHAQTLLNHIATLKIGDENNLICYIIRGTREKAPQSFRDKCLLVSFKVLGEHLSLVAVTSVLVTMICIINTSYAFILYRQHMHQLKLAESPPLNITHTQLKPSPLQGNAT